MSADPQDEALPIALALITATIKGSPVRPAELQAELCRDIDPHEVIKASVSLAALLVTAFAAPEAIDQALDTVGRGITLANQIRNEARGSA